MIVKHVHVKGHWVYKNIEIRILQTCYVYVYMHYTLSAQLPIFLENKATAQDSLEP